jgi:hypothetical protein
MTITLMTMSDASAKSPSMASFRAGGLVRAAEASQSPAARPRKSHWLKRVCRRAPAEHQVDITAERLKNAPKLSENDNWGWPDRVRDQEVYDYPRVTYYRGAE